VCDYSGRGVDTKIVGGDNDGVGGNGDTQIVGGDNDGVRFV